eukprot:COSAG02_NODE_5578_length_4217_cov_1.646673_3_plen_140_part_00
MRLVQGRGLTWLRLPRPRRPPPAAAAGARSFLYSPEWVLAAELDGQPAVPPAAWRTSPWQRGGRLACRPSGPLPPGAPTLQQCYRSKLAGAPAAAPAAAAAAELGGRTRYLRHGRLVGPLPLAHHICRLAIHMVGRHWW